MFDAKHLMNFSVHLNEPADHVISWLTMAAEEKKREKTQFCWGRKRRECDGELETYNFGNHSEVKFKQT